MDLYLAGMRQLAISFSVAFLLAAGLLFTFLQSAYTEERDLLVERIDGDLTKLQTRHLIDRIKLLHEGRVDTVLRDTVFRLGTFDLPETELSNFLSKPTVNLRISQWEEDPDWYKNLRMRSGAGTQRADTAVLDSLGARYHVTLQHYANAEEVEAAGGLIVRFQSNPFGLQTNSDKAVIAATEYQRTVLRGLTYEFFFSGLLLLAIGFAASSAYRSLQERNRQLADREALLANLSHELKTPVAAVQIALEALDRFGADADPVRRSEYIALSRGELSRLDRLAEYSITALRMNHQRPSGERQSVDVARLTTGVWNTLMFRYRLTDDQLNISVQQTLESVRLYRQEFELAVVNLLENGIKYGGTPARLSVDASRRGNTLIYRVSDNGPGIPTVHADRIFERFYRITNDRSGHHVKGHGLGLSLVRQVASLHGGTVSVSVAQEGGALFTLQLPLS